MVLALLVLAMGVAAQVQRRCRFEQIDRIQDRTLDDWLGIFQASSVSDRDDLDLVFGFNIVCIYSFRLDLSEGIHTFETSSDDGSVLYSEKTLLVDNDGRHGTISRNSGPVMVSGDPTYALLWFQAGGGKKKKKKKKKKKRNNNNKHDGNDDDDDDDDDVVDERGRNLSSDNGALHQSTDGAPNKDSETMQQQQQQGSRSPKSDEKNDGSSLSNIESSMFNNGRSPKSESKSRTADFGTSSTDIERRRLTVGNPLASQQPLARSSNSELAVSTSLRGNSSTNRAWRHSGSAMSLGHHHKSMTTPLPSSSAIHAPGAGEKPVADEAGFNVYSLY
eukprot:jgi/Bigna1/139326/aug1.49_g14034